MAAISFQCRNAACGKKISANEKMAGKKARCPHCSQVVLVPTPVTAGATSTGKAGAQTSTASPAPAAPSFPSAPPKQPLLVEFPTPQRWIELDSPYQDLFLRIARPDLYRTNPFRLTELPVDATEQQINRQTEKIRLMENYGGAKAKSGPFPLDPPPDAEALRQAVQRLRDPQVRLADEFFWFWPCQDQSQTPDPALAHLARGDVAAAEKVWSELSLSNNIALHNLAVLYHLRVLEAEYAALIGQAVSWQELRGQWRKSYQLWRQLWKDAAFWGRLKHRILKLNDARLPPELADHLCKSLPFLLFAINAQLATYQAEKGNVEEARDYLQDMKGAGFPADSVQVVLGWAVEPIRERLESMCKSAAGRAQEKPFEADKEAEQLLEQGGALLQVIDAFLDEEHTTRVSVHDELTLQILGCLIAYGNKTEDWGRSRKLLKKAVPLAASVSTRERLAENLKTLAKNKKANNSWCGKGYYDLPKRALKRMEKARIFAEVRQWDDAIQILDKMLLEENSPIELEHEPLVTKALAYSLNGQALDELKSAMDEFSQPPSIVVKIVNSGGRREAFRAWLIAKGNADLAALNQCAACGVPLLGEYLRFTYKGVPFEVCSSCGAESQTEQEERKSNLSEKLDEAATKLLRAHELDPDNKMVRDNLKEAEKIAKEIGAEMPAAPTIARCPECERMMPNSEYTCPHCGGTQWTSLTVHMILTGVLMAVCLIAAVLVESWWRWLLLTVGVCAGIGLLTLVVHLKKAMDAAQDEDDLEGEVAPVMDPDEEVEDT